MIIKVVYDQEIHVLQTLTESLKQLVEAIQTSFQSSVNKLPQNISLHYLDPDGDKIMLTSDQDLKSLNFLAEALKLKSLRVIVNENVNSQVYQSQVIENSSILNEEDQSSIFDDQMIVNKEVANKSKEPVQQVKVNEIREQPIFAVEPIQEPAKEKEINKVDIIKNSDDNVFMGVNLNNGCGMITNFIQQMMTQTMTQNTYRKREHCDSEEKKEKRCKKKAQKEAKRAQKSLEKQLEKSMSYEKKCSDKKVKMEDLMQQLHITDIKECPKYAKMQHKISKMVKEGLMICLPQITDYVSKQLESMNFAQQQQQPQESKVEVAVHDKYVCDGCAMTPIIGIRYKCSVCNNFDLCGKCESNFEHNHPFLKIKNPKQSPVFLMTTLAEDYQDEIPVEKKQNIQQAKSEMIQVPIIEEVKIEEQVVVEDKKKSEIMVEEKKVEEVVIEYQDKKESVVIAEEKPLEKKDIYPTEIVKRANEVANILGGDASDYIDFVKNGVGMSIGELINGILDSRN